MAKPGPAPKPAEERRRRNVDTTPQIVLPAGGYTGPFPPLPEPAPAPFYAWHQLTVEWYETWARSPQAAVFLDTDWMHLRNTAFLVEELYRGTSKSPASIAAEIRLRESKWGATIEDRAKLRMSLGEPEVGEGAARAKTEESKARRKRVMKSVGSAG